MGYSGFMITDEERARLLATFTPRFDDVRASHITFEILSDKIIPAKAEIEIVGYASNDKIEALIVSVDGSTIRPDNGIFHITLSHQPGVASKESNKMLQNADVQRIPPMPIKTKPFFSRGTQYRTTELG